MRADTGEVDHGHEDDASQPVEEHAGGADLRRDIEVADHQERKFDGPNEVADGNGLLSVWPFIQTEADIEVDRNQVNVAAFEPDQDTPKALRFRVLVVASHHILGQGKDRFTTMVGEGPGPSRLGLVFPTSLDGLPNGGGSWCAKPVPAQAFGSPPGFVQRDAHEVRFCEAEQARLLVLGHLVQVGPKLSACQGHIVEANLEPFWRLPKQAEGLLAVRTFTQRLVEQEEAHRQLGHR